MAPHIVQIALAAADLDRATAFYADLLGVDPAARFDPPGLVFFDLAGVRLLLNSGGGPVSEATTTFAYLGVTDLGATIDRLRAQGTPIESEPHPIFHHGDDTLGPAGTDEWQAFIRDTEGNLVCLVEQVPRI